MKGVIEGFYGKSWSWQARRDYAAFLAQIGYDTYIYAPKSDTHLRSQWQQAWPVDNQYALSRLRQVYRSHSIQFGFGLSPVGLTHAFSAQKNQYFDALQRLMAYEPDVLCLLFDDMLGGDPDLAKKQLEVAAETECRLPRSVKLIFCPSYYSKDPVLDDVFGARPAGYLEALGDGLSNRWSVFWTGQQVVTLEYDTDDLDDVSQSLRRRPVLWDNYPVNDGRTLWPFINLQAKPRRQIAAHCEGYLHNGMNQAYCSMITLARMAGCQDIPSILGISEDLWALLELHEQDFQTVGLHGMTTQTKKQLLQCRALYSHAIGKEVIAWLNGEFEFDPACLT